MDPFEVGGGFEGSGGQILILEQCAKRIVIAKPNTKFERTSLKHLEVIQSWKTKEK